MIKASTHYRGYKVIRRAYAGTDYWYIERPDTWHAPGHRRGVVVPPSAPGFSGVEAAFREVDRLLELAGFGRKRVQP